MSFELRVGAARDPARAVALVGEFDARLGLTPALRQARLERMAQDAHRFFRSSPALFHADLEAGGAFARAARLLERPAPLVPIDGDPHLENFGAFRGPDGHAVWGLDDYDQAGVGSPERDLARLATSAVLAARAAGLSPELETKLARAIGAEYFETIAGIAAGRERAPGWIAGGEAAGAVRSLLLAADAEDAGDFVAEHTAVLAGGRVEFRLNDEIRLVTRERARALREALAGYERGLGPTPGVARPLRVLALAEKLGSGGASFGLERYYALVASDRAGGDARILEVKELLPSPLPARGKAAGPAAAADARGIIDAQRALGGLANPLLGEARMRGRSFLVRELEPERSRVALRGVRKPDDLLELARQAARVLARAHGRAPGSAAAIDAWAAGDAEIAAERLAAFARRYADQAEADRRALVDALAAGDRAA